MAARWSLLALVCTIMNIFWVVPERHSEDLIYNHDVIHLLFILLDPTAGGFVRLVSINGGTPK